MALERSYRLRSGGGEVLASLRKSAGLSQRALADAAGVTRGAISHLEHGRSHGVERVHAEAIAKRLGMDEHLHLLFDVPPPAVIPNPRSPHANPTPPTGSAQRWPAARRPNRRAARLGGSV